jgi:hypothetical protein
LRGVVNMISQLRDVIKSYMQLSENQIYIDNQDFKLGNTESLVVILQPTTSTIRASNKILLDDGTEEQAIYTSESYTINAISKNDDARTRKNEIIFALNSQIAENSQREYKYKIFKIPNSFANVSAAEAGSMLNRYAIEVVVYATYTTINTVDYYDDFSNGQQITIET